MPFPRLPESPTFPVYGLGDQFEGPRSLVMWNQPSRLYTVTLVHGLRETGPWISVETVAKTPRAWIDAHNASGPTGTHDAAFAAVFGLVQMATANRSEHRKMFADETADLDTDLRDGYSPALLGPGWEEDQLVVEGVARLAFSRRTPEAWATIADLDTVAVALNGPASMASLGTHIVDVRPTLDTYN